MKIKGPLTKEERLKKNLLILIVLNSSLILFAIIYTSYFLLTKDTDFEIRCVIKESLHIYCPGCGGSRSLSAFMRLDFINSFILYPAIPISALVVLSYDVRLILSIVKKDTSFTDKYRFFPFIIIAVSIILQFIVRNVFLIFFSVDIIGDILV